MGMEGRRRTLKTRLRVSPVVEVMVMALCGVSASMRLRRLGIWPVELMPPRFHAPRDEGGRRMT
jgi:hypothetical protein